MLDKKQLKELLDIALETGGDFADIYLEDRRNTGIVCEADKIERINTGVDIGGGVRIISGEATAYAYTNDVSFEGLAHAAKVAREVVEKGQPATTVDLTAQNPVFNIDIKKRPDAVDIDAKVDAILRANKTARDMDDRIKQVSVGFGDVVQQVTIANSEGVFVEDERIRTRFTVHVVAGENGVIQTGYDALGGAAGFEVFEDMSPEEVAASAGTRALLMLSAKPAPAGKMPVVMAAEAGGTMVHEACGHGLEADLVQKNLSVYGGKVGQKVASELVTVIDDATIGNKYGSFRFDDEGVVGQKTVLIENGILKDYMYDRLTARKDKRESTGNGRRESFHEKPIPRMTNTYIASGKEDSHKIIKETKSGLLVKKMGGGQVNTTNGDFVFDVAEGYLIENGEIITPVRGATLTGNGPEALNRVERVGNDLGYTIGTCGKDGQGAPVSDAQPTILISELIVGGTAHGDDQSPTIKRIRRI